MSLENDAADTLPDAPPPAPPEPGFIDLYGYSSKLSGWFFWGWVGRRGPTPGEAAVEVSAVFDDGDMVGPATAAFFPRTDLGERGMGVIVFAEAPAPTASPLRLLTLSIDGVDFPANVGAATETLVDSAIFERIAPLVSFQMVRKMGRETFTNLLFKARLPRQPPAAPAPAPAAPQAEDAEPGFIDIYGCAPALAGWLFWGWIRLPDATPREEKTQVSLIFKEGRATSAATLAIFQRPDLKSIGVGVCVHVSCNAGPTWRLHQMQLTIGGRTYRADAGRRSERLEAKALIETLSPHVRDRLESGRGLETFTTMFSRVFQGQDTLASLASDIRLEIDTAILCPPDGLLLIGWRLLRPGAIAGVRIRSGARAHPLRFDDCQPINRPDVAGSGLGQELGVDDPRCGFIAYAPNCVVAGEATYLEVETAEGEVAFRLLKVTSPGGIEPIKRVLGGADVRYDELDAAFDKVLGPAVASLSAHRLAATVSADIIEFGEMPKAPLCSVIVPLYGRMDFLEYQMALFSEHPGSADMEYIYVLDDPPRRRELENLAQSVFARFEIPFRLVLLGRNLGFAPANNQGLRTARGEYICFLNSDAFPITPDWVERLTDDLKAQPNIGVIGPRLLFEDGSIQHEGCFYRPIKEFGGWMYVDHDNRGRRPGPETGIKRAPCITGACMVMRRDLAVELGGFDEAYVIGDFEDSDLCKKVISLGLDCAVDLDVTLHHLERQSMAGSRELWRQNLTLHNAWVHQRRWYPAPLALSTPDAETAA